MSDKKIDSLKHKKATRARIPSKEEAGCEPDQPSKAELPLNPVTTRGQDPELYWLEKYGAEDDADALDLDIRSLYRTEHIAPEKLIQRLYRLKREQAQQDDLFVDDLFANYKDIDELDKPTFYYKQADQWANRLIQGDSLLVMGSLLEREGMKGQVQMIYIDPPYGIKYNSNWQIRVGDRNVKDGDDASLSGEPEVIKAFRDTWELGIHSYLSYLRDRLLVGRQLLGDSGSCFVQISDENVHLVRCVMDEVFGSENFCGLISFKKTTSASTNLLASVSDYIIWYAKARESVKYRQIYLEKRPGEAGASQYTWVQYSDGKRANLGASAVYSELPKGARLFAHDNITSQRPAQGRDVRSFEFDGKSYSPGAGTFKTDLSGLQRLASANRLMGLGNTLRFVRFFEDFPVAPITNLWDETVTSGFSDKKVYVVQTHQLAIQRCILMTTDPGDLVLDPTCGSGTTAYVAEQWGRRWITTDTSRVALNIAKTRLMTATFPWYTLKDEKTGLPRDAWDVRHGFDYKMVQRVTLGSLANDEPPEEVTLFDQPATNNKTLRISGPFTVETLQSFEPLSPEAVDEASLDVERLEAFQNRVFEHLKSAGVKNGQRNENAVFVRIDPLTADYLHAEGYYDTAEGEQKAYIHLGPQFAPVSKAAVNEAVKACRARGDAQWLLILGFAFESDVENSVQNQRAGAFRVDKVRMHDDLLQAGLTKKDKKAATFVTIGEPDISVVRELWVVDREGRRVAHGDVVEKLSRIDGLAGGNGLDAERLRFYALAASRREVWLDLANATGSGVGSGEYRGGAGTGDTRGVHPVSWDRQGFIGGTGDFDGIVCSLGFADERSLRAALAALRTHPQTAQWLATLAQREPLATTHQARITINGLDIYDPIKDEVKARSVADIAYWMVDDDYDGANFMVRQVFFCGGDKDEFAKWQKGISDLAKVTTRRRVENTLRIELDDEAFDRIYGFVSHPLPYRAGKRVAVRVVSQFGEESTKVLAL